MQKGFTFIELLLMVTLLGIMVVFFIESAGDLSNVGIDAASRKVQSDIRYAQLLAQTTGSVHGAKFNAGGIYEVYIGTPGNYVTDPVTKQSMTENFSKYPGVSITTNYEVRFDSKGRPTMGADASVRLTATSGAIRDVYVVDQTGAVVIDLIGAGSGCGCTLCWGQAPFF